MGSAYSFGRIAQPRYARVAQALVESIEAGRYPVGALLPTEADLCGQFSVSRTTVREAMRQLHDMGLVSGKAGVGTLVRAKYVKPKFVHAVASVSDIFQYAGASDQPRILSRKDMVAGTHEAELLHCPVGQHWILIESIRAFANEDVLMAYIHAYIPPAFEGILESVTTSNEPMYVSIERIYGQQVYEVQQEFKALTLDARQADILKVQPSSAGLMAVRHYHGADGGLLLVTVSVYPADRFSYAMRLRYNPQSTKE
jgi:DNA-binding GntR family transcriptional regulator